MREGTEACQRRQCPRGLNKAQTPARTPAGEAADLIEGVVSALATASKKQGHRSTRASRSSHDSAARFNDRLAARHSRCGNYRLESRMRENRPYGSEGGEAKPSRPLSRG